MRDPELEQVFPGLAGGTYALTSPDDPAYNCVAWALGDITQFWYDVRVRGYYWPPGAASADTISGWIEVFSMHGYQLTSDASLEPDCEKIAIYVEADGAPTHVSQQKGSGVWTSKLGKGKDIEHPNPAALEGREYGRVAYIMKRFCRDGRRLRE